MQCILLISLGIFRCEWVSFQRRQLWFEHDLRKHCGKLSLRLPDGIHQRRLLKLVRRYTYPVSVIHRFVPFLNTVDNDACRCFWLDKSITSKSYNFINYYQYNFSLKIKSNIIGKPRINLEFSGLQTWTSVWRTTVAVEAWRAVTQWEAIAAAARLALQKAPSRTHAKVSNRFGKAW